MPGDRYDVFQVGCGSVNAVLARQGRLVAVSERRSTRCPLSGAVFLDHELYHMLAAPVTGDLAGRAAAAYRGSAVPQDQRTRAN